MNYKCRFCGYRFKDKDEQICPECFTAREEDISCGAFSEDDHSHYFSVSDLEREESFFSKNDTFKEERNEFLDDERRNESRTAAARYERTVKKQAAKQNNIPRQTNIPSQTGSVLPNQNVYSRQPYDPNQRVSITNYNLNRPPQQKPKKTNGCGCFLALCIISIMFSVGTNIWPHIGIGENNSAETNTAPQSEPTAPDTQETNGISPSAQTSKDGSYYVKVSDFTITDMGVIELTDEECAKFNILNTAANVDDVIYSNDMAFDLVRADFTVELYKTDLESDFNQIDYLVTFSMENSENTYYEYFIPNYDDSLKIEFNTKGSDGETAFEQVNGVVVYKPSTENIEFIVGVSNGADREDFVFELN